MGEDGAGHYVKMVHNGIEYGDMQLICEAYNLMKNGLGMTRRRDARGLRRVEQGRTRLATSSRSPATSSPSRTTDGTPLVDKILDTAGQKGTGKWTVITSQDLGIPITLIAEAVYSRCVSALKDERVGRAQS